MSHPTWGGRFKKPLDRRVCQFNASLHVDYVLYKQDILGSKAHAKMLAKQHLLSPEESLIICNALDEIEKELNANLHPLDDEQEDIHMFIEHLLIDKIGDLGKKLHTGRSRNDQVALDLRLYCRTIFMDVSHHLNELIEAFKVLSDHYQDVSMPGYTHLQQAQPIQLGNYFSAYGSMFKRDLNRLEDWYQRMNYSPLGAGALAGSTLPLDRDWIAKHLGFKGIIENTIDAVSDRDFIMEFSGVASIIMVHLSRLCEDLILWCTQEFNYITLDDSFATGSSLMPNKKNPDVLELIRGKSGRVFGHLMSILTIMKGLPLAYNKDMQEDKVGLFDTNDTLIACLTIIIPFLKSLTFNTNIMNSKANSGYLNATAILEKLVLNGMPFRDAHHQVGLWVSEAMKFDLTLDQLLEKKEQATSVAVSRGDS